MSVISNNLLAGASGQGGSGYKISRSLRFNPSDSSYLSRTPSSAGNRKTWTWSGWLKRSGLGVLNQLFVTQSSGTAYTALYIDSSNKLRFEDYESSAQSQLFTTQVFRDVSAWQHIVVAVDTTQATASNRVKLYVNGQQVTEFDTETYMSQNRETYINNTVDTRIGGGQAANQFLNGYLAEVHFIDGQALAASDFGEYDDNNVWQPKEFKGTYNAAASISSYPAVTISPSALGSGSDVSHVNGGGSYFYSQAQTGAGSVKVEFSSPITGVTSIKMNGGGYGVGSTYHIKINGSDVLTNLTTASGWGQVEHTITSTDISSFEVYTTNAGWSLYNLLFNDVSPSGTASIVTPAGVNGFHLDFSDNSSDAALGINTAVADDFTSTVGALTTTQAADFYSVGSNPAGNLFDGSTSTMVYGGYNNTSTNSDLVWTPNGAYTASSSLRVYAGYYSTIYVNGVSKATGGESSAPGWVTLSHTGSITSIKFENTANSYVARAAAIEVDGTVAVTTAWTVNNLTAENPTTLPGVVFDGIGDHVESADHADYSLGTNDFTIEFYVFPREFVSYDALVMKYAGNASNSSWWMSTNSSGHILFYLYYGSSEMGITTAGTGMNLNKWNHVACVRDGSTARVYINGVQVGTGSISTNSVNDSATALRIGEDSTGGYDLNGIMSNVRLVNGTCLYPNGTTFTVPSTPLTNVTNTKLLCCQSSSSATDATVSPNTLTKSGDTFATERSDGTSADDSLIDTPTNYDDGTNIGGNYPTWNPLINSNQTFSNGNLELTTATNYIIDSATMYTPPGTGKWYWEFVQTARSGTDYTLVGMLPRDSSYVQGNSDIPQNVGGIGLYIGQNGVAYVASGAATAGTTSATFDVGDILGWAFDAENGTVKCYKNGVAQGTQFTNVRTDIGWTFCVTDYDHNTVSTYAINFGQRPFAYTPPTGYKSLCTTNLPDPTIADGSTAMDVVTYTGNSSTQAISGLNISPDLVWIKNRSGSSYHVLCDEVRGAGKILAPNGTQAEWNDSDSQTAFTSFDTNGFTVSDNQSSWSVNGSGSNYVAWAWDAGDSNTTISAGSLNSSAYNTSDKWSDDVSGNTYGGASMPKSKLFNGLLDNNVIANSGTTLTFSPSGLSSISSLRIYGSSYTRNANGIVINGTDYTSSFPQGGNSVAAWVTIPETSLTSVAWSTTGSGLENGSLYAIEVDGKLLVDNDQTPPNVPSIASTVRANPSAGISIINYVGAGSAGNFAHGLNAAPEFFILKNRDLGYNWLVWHKDIGVNHYLYLDSNNAKAYLTYFFAEAPDSNVIKISTGVGVTSNTRNHIVYAFAPVEGFSAFGKFSGNSSTDGPFQYCGFKPRFLLLKGITQARDWIILDTERDAGNVGDSYLHPNTNGAENTYAIADILGNGFKMRYNGGLANQTGEDYIWAAFAEHPFKNSRAR